MINDKIHARCFSVINVVWPVNMHILSTAGLQYPLPFSVCDTGGYVTVGLAVYRFPQLVNYTSILHSC